jgi:hypothetical protein
MSTLRIDLDDEAASLVQRAAAAQNRSIEDWLRDNIQQAAARVVGSAQPTSHRVSPLHPGAMQPASDFNEPLEEFAPYK